MVTHGSNEDFRYNLGNVPRLTINRYTIFRDGKAIENNLIGWRTALAHARKWSIDLFYNVRKIEIMNVYTAEIISLEEAERRTKEFISAQKLKERSH